MGWAGVVTLIAAACFLLYRHPPASWSSESPPLSRPRTRSTSEKPVTFRTTEDRELDRSRKSDLTPVGLEDGITEEPQTTPKASASNGPLLQVPLLQLDGHEADNVAATEDQPDPHQGQNASTSPSAFLVPTIVAGQNNAMPPPPLIQQSTARNTSLMPPPPPPSRMRPPVQQKQPQTLQAAAPSLLSLTAGRYPQRVGSGGNSTLSPPPSAAASLRVPPNVSRLTSSTLAPTQLKLKPAKKASQRAVLEPGYSPLDWAALTSNPNHKLRGENLPPTLIRVTPSMLKTQNGRKGTDAWTSYQGKVYNITPYLPFHPGGKGELLRGAGKDSGKLFLEIHPWVNWDAILGECLVGILVSENEEANENSLDAMD